MKNFFAIRGFVGALLWASVLASHAAEPVQFVFHLPPDNRDPFARDLWAEVLTPSQKILRLPVFFYGSGQFAVRARATEVGDYRLGTVTEKSGERSVTLAVTAIGQVKQTVKQPASLPQVVGHRGKPAQFLTDNGQPFVPLGANVAWASGTDRVRFYVKTMADFNQQGLNWMRVWMAHWGGLNLEWLPPDMGASPPRGILNLQVAANWDKIVSAAEEKAVYLQIVLQHHGQYSTTVNPNWKEHPWNAANRGGFLASPGEFFTSEIAIGLTALKYRYIVARWGYSPAILAWELFNEVHWTDPINQQHDDSTVAQWHDAMADYIRSVDQYDHFITTSTEDLGSPIYAKMDFLQPHLYAQNMLAGARQFAVSPEKFDRPIFYGEVGDDHMELTTAQKESGIAIVPPVWASLMGQGYYAAQPWLGEKLMQVNRLGELGAVARFLQATGLGRRQGLAPFSALVECEVRVPFALAAGQVWQRRAAPDFTVPIDGREVLEFGDVPRSYVGSKQSLAFGFPARGTYHIDFPREMTLRARIANVSPKGGGVRISVDGKTAVEKTWMPPIAETPTKEKPVLLSFTVPAGKHTLVVENPGVPDWVELASIEFPHAIPALASIGQRAENFVTAWVWHREGVFALKSPAPATGALMIEDVPAGTWHVVWWDTLKGVPFAPTSVTHGGGTLKVPTPPINRHAAVVLTLQK
jgi:hypothetical protein